MFLLDGAAREHRPVCNVFSEPGTEPGVQQVLDKHL